MLIARHKFLLILAMLLLLPLVARAAERNLLAHADETGNKCWLAQVLPVSGSDPRSEETIPWVKDFGREWQEMPHLPGRAICLASLDGELVAVMDDGSWFVLSNTPRLGPPLPNGAIMRAAATGDHQLWAIGLAPMESAATKPTTAAISPAVAAPEAVTPEAATQPATMPVPRQLVLYRYAALGGESASWQVVTPLPEGIPDDPASLSMVFVQEKVFVAWHQADETVAIVHLPSFGAWSEPLVINDEGGIGDFKLLDVKDRPELWTTSPLKLAATQPSTQPALQPGQIHRGQDFAEVRPLTISGQQPPADVIGTVVFSASRLRLLMISGDQKFELLYEPDKLPTTRLTMVLPTLPEPIPLETWLVAGAALLAVATATGLSRRNNLADLAKRPNTRLMLAPVLNRLAAGAIDAAPILVVLYAIATGDRAPTFATNVHDAVRLLILGTLAYLAHTTVAEVMCGQSIGKIIVGLQVVTANSGSPTLKSLLIRNAMRVVDLLMLPLLMIVATPLHQRLGDMVAGTVVVVKELPPPRNDLDD